MLIGRVRTDAGVTFVRVDRSGGGERFIPIEDPFAAFAAGRAPADAGDAVTGEVLAPVDTRLILGIAQNGPGHPSPVQAWLKSPRTVVASGVPVQLRRDAGETVAEGEITVVIGRDASGLTAQNAHEYVLGVTAVNDLSQPDRGAFDPRNFESKSGVGYTPLGPWIDTDADIATAPLTMEIDGVEVARTRADALPVPIAEVLAYVAGWTPLGPGDVIMTGAPFSNFPITPGQRVDIVVGEAHLTTPTH